MDSVKLNNGVSMPMLGLGTFKSTDSSDSIDSVTSALELGYRMIDTARMYKNEEYVGEISNLSVEGTASNGVTTYTAEVMINEPGNLRPSMNVDASVIGIDTPLQRSGATNSMMPGRRSRIH